MFKKWLAAILFLLATTAFAAVDVNKARQADLESIKGIGPVISGKILDERKKGPFKDWNDMVTRVRGIGEGNAARFSADGMTINGASFKGAPVAATKPESKAAMKSEPKTAPPANDVGKTAKSLAPSTQAPAASAPSKKR